MAKSFEQTHADATRGLEYGEECVLPCSTGRALHCPAYPAPCDYIRIVDSKTGDELAYWASDEWQEAPEEVMGAIMGALRGEG